MLPKNVHSRMKETKRMTPERVTILIIVFKPLSLGWQQAKIEYAIIDRNAAHQPVPLSYPLVHENMNQNIAMTSQNISREDQHFTPLASAFIWVVGAHFPFPMVHGRWAALFPHFTTNML